MTPRTRVSHHLKPEILSYIDREASVDRRSRANMIERLLEEALARRHSLAAIAKQKE